METKTYKLTILDRITLPSILKTEANYTTLIINKDIKKKVEITQDELVKYKFKNLPNGSITWNIEKDQDSFETEFTSLEATEITACLNKLEQDNKLTEDHLGLYELFVK